MKPLDLGMTIEDALHRARCTVMHGDYRVLLAGMSCAASVLADEVEKLRAENAELAGALQDLFDEMAGTPVSIVSTRRGPAMVRARLALKAAEAAGGK